MKYISLGFIQRLMEYSGNPVVAKNIELMARYEKTFQTEIPRIANREIYVIGMLHRGWYSSSNDSARQSQQLVTKLLTEINPDIVGVEGFCGQNFTLENLLEESFAITRTPKWKISNEQRENSLREYAHDGMTNGVLNYQKLNPAAKFWGIETIELSQLFFVLDQQLRAERMSGYSDDSAPTRKLWETVNVIRGIMFIAKMGRLIKNLPKAEVAIPVGYSHLNEIAGLAKVYNAKWKLIDTTIDLGNPHS